MIVNTLLTHVTVFGDPTKVGAVLVAVGERLAAAPAPRLGNQEDRHVRRVQSHVLGAERHPEVPGQVI